MIASDGNSYGLRLTNLNRRRALLLSYLACVYGILHRLIEGRKSEWCLPQSPFLWTEPDLEVPA